MSRSPHLPAIGTGIGALAPGAGFETGRRSALRKPGDIGPLGGTVTNSYSTPPPKRPRQPDAEYVEPPPR
jgi:hypothetical protein